jgi:hypothetical protein
MIFQNIKTTKETKWTFKMKSTNTKIKIVTMQARQLRKDFYKIIFIYVVRRHRRLT